MILSNDKQYKLTPRNKAIEFIRMAISDLKVEDLKWIVGGDHQEVLFRMTDNERLEVDNQLKELKRVINERCLKERGKKVLAGKL